MNVRLLSKISALVFICTNALSQSLTLDWQVEYPTRGPSSLEFDKILVDDEDNVYHCGWSITDKNQFLYSSAILTQKYDSSGTLLWENKFDNTSSDQFIDCAFTPNNSITIGGTRGNLSEASPARAELINYDLLSGEELWRRYIFDTVNVIAGLTDIDIDDEGNIFAFGIVNLDQGIHDSTKMFVAKVDALTGEVIWTDVSQTDFSAVKGKVLEDRIRIFGTRKLEGGGATSFLKDIDFSGDVITSADLPSIQYGPGIFNPYFFFDKDGYFITYGYQIYKWEVSETPVWSFDMTQGLPQKKGQARIASVAEDGSIYASGNLYDSLTMEFSTLTVRLSKQGERIWSNSNNFKEDDTWEGGQAISVDGNYVFLCTRPWYQENNLSWEDYHIAILSAENGNILKDTIIDGNIRDIPYFSENNNNHFYLLGRSYISNSQNPDDYRSKIFKFSVDEMVNTEAEIGFENSVAIHPNPANEFITITQNSTRFYTHIQLFDSSGKFLFSKEINSSEAKIALPRNLANGIYLIKLKGKSLPILNKKIVVQRK